MKYEYIKDHSEFGALRQIPEMLQPNRFDYGEQRERFNLDLRKYTETVSTMPLYPLSVQPSEEWMQRKEYEEGVDFEKQILCPICKVPMQHNQSSHCAWLECPVCNSGARLAETDTLPCVAIPIEKKGEDGELFYNRNVMNPYPSDSQSYTAFKKGFTIGWQTAKGKIERDDLVASQNHPQPESSVATLACTEGNSIEQWENLYAVDCIRTFTGVYISFLNPTEEMIRIEDIAHSLSMQCRFGGHLPTFYSVAEHSLNCSYLIDNPYKKLEALMHDASEAYLMDIPRPVKRNLSNYKEIEDGLMRLIAKKYGFAWPLSKEVKEVDEQMLNLEWECLMLGRGTMNFPSKHPHEVKSDFLKMFKYYTHLLNSDQGSTSE